MPIHFEPREFSERRERVREKMRSEGLDCLLVFSQESMYYLTGYDTMGFVFFQCLVVPESGTITLLTRLPDLAQAEQTSIIDDIRIWVDNENAEPCEQLKSILEEKRLKRARLGVEYKAFGLTGYWAKRVDAALDGFGLLVDASDLISQIRARKSPQEIAYVRKAAELADASLSVANRMSVAGTSEADILAEMQAVVVRGDGDLPANAQIMGSGRRALMCRYYAGRRRLDPTDQMMIEFAGSFRHYHAVIMRVILIGGVDDHQRRMYETCRYAFDATFDSIRPGVSYGEAFAAYADVIDAAGFREQRLNACGYGVGASFSGSWVDWPMLYENNSVLIEPGMTIFLDTCLIDRTAGQVVALGETVCATEGKAERLSTASHELTIN